MAHLATVVALRPPWSPPAAAISSIPWQDGGDGFVFLDEMLDDADQVLVIAEVFGSAATGEEEAHVLFGLDVLEGDGGLEMVALGFLGDVPGGRRRWGALRGVPCCRVGLRGRRRRLRSPLRQGGKRGKGCPSSPSHRRWASTLCPASCRPRPKRRLPGRRPRRWRTWRSRGGGKGAWWGPREAEDDGRCWSRGIAGRGAGMPPPRRERCRQGDYRIRGEQRQVGDFGAPSMICSDGMRCLRRLLGFVYSVADPRPAGGGARRRRQCDSRHPTSLRR